MRARVLLSEPVGLLDYSIPEELSAHLAVGLPVRVPLGKRTTRAWIAEIADGPGPMGVTLRDLLSIDKDLTQQNLSQIAEHIPKFF